MTHVLDLGEMVSVNAALYPDRPAIRDASRSLTYAAYEARCNRLANGLLGLGLEHGDRVGVYARNRLEWMEIYVACAKAGLVAVPVNFRLAGPEVRYVLEDCDARAMLVEDALLGVMDEVRGSVPISENAWIQVGGESAAPGYRLYEDVLGASASTPPGIAVRPEEPWTIMYTSGTTGRPKGAIRSHESYAHFWMLNAAEFAFGHEDRGLCVMPLCHVNSVFYGFVFLYRGASVSVYDRPGFDPEDLLRVLAEQGITFTSLVPTHYVMMLDVPGEIRGRHDLRRVEKLMISSAPARRETKLSIMECFPNSKLYEAYGSTEAGLVTLLRPEEQLTKLGSIGREIFGSGRIRLLDPFGEEVPDGEVGELFSRTPTTFDGYWNRPEASARAFRGEWCTAGDMARRDEDGFYTLVDRKSNVIITGGEKVYPSEVELVLATHPDVQDVAVVAIPDPKWGEAVTAFVVPRAGATLDPQALIETARRDLAGFKCPKAVHVIESEEMPRTATGKILHRVLRERFGGGGVGTA